MELIMKSNNVEACKLRAYEAVEALRGALLDLEKEVNESEVEQVILKEVLPGLVSEAGICGTTIYNKMEVVKECQIDSITTQRYGGIDRGLRVVGMEGLCWLMD